MNEIRRPDPEAEEIARIRGIVDRHELPEFVTGFEVRLGEFEGDPAMWIIFRTTGKIPPTRDAQRQRAAALSHLQEVVHRSLLAGVEGRYPYYRFAEPKAANPVGA